MKEKLSIYINNPKAPKPNKPLTPGVCGVIINEKNEILLHKRSDITSYWSLPGGMMKLGESIAQCCIREIREEMKLEVTPKRVIGIYSSPECIFAWSDGSVYQSFVIAFLCKIYGNNISNVVLNNESDDYGWFGRNDIGALATLPYVKEIIEESFSETQCTFYD